MPLELNLMDIQETSYKEYAFDMPFKTPGTIFSPNVWLACKSLPLQL